MRDQIISDVWIRSKAWSSAANRFQKQLKNWRRRQLICIIAGSAMATAAATDLFGLNAASGDSMAVGNRIISGCAAVALALVGFIQQNFLSLSQTESWPRARSVSEALKCEVYRFRAGASPYEVPPEQDVTTALQHLSSVIAEEEDKVGDLLPEVRFDEETADGVPGPMAPDDYIKSRLNDQIDAFYLPLARKNLHQAKTARGATLALALLGLVIAGFMSAGLLIAFGAWVAVLTTISAAVGSFSALSRYESLASLYAKQALSLDRLRTGWRSGRYTDWSDFVNKCEETILAENRSWMAEMVKEVDTLVGVLPEERYKSGSP